LPITSQGATFFFTIEAAEVELKDSVSPEPDTIALVQQKSLRLLSVVENTIHLQILTLTAQSLAMVVRNASSALEALTWLQSGEEFDLAIIALRAIQNSKFKIHSLAMTRFQALLMS